MTEPIRFFLPGPSYVPEDVRQAMTGPMVGHRSAGFRAFTLSLAERLPKVLRTAGDAMLATGNSTLVMAAAVVSCVDAEVLLATPAALATMGAHAEAERVPLLQPQGMGCGRTACGRTSPFSKSRACSRPGTTAGSPAVLIGARRSARCWSGRGSPCCWSRPIP